jgi:alpha-mannosidase
VTVLLDHASEYELVNGGSELAITLLRSVGSMSVNLHPLRDEPAGSEIPVPGAQELGTQVTARLGILAHGGGWAPANAVARAASFREPGAIVRGSGPSGSALPSPRSALSVTNGSIAVSSLRKVDGGIELRLVNLSDRVAEPEVTGPFSRIEERDLLGRPLEGRPGGGEIRQLNPWDISTFLLTD